MRSLKTVALAGALTIMTTSLPAQAAKNSSELNSESFRPKPTLTTQFKISSDLKENDDSEHQLVSSFWFVPAWQFSPDLSLTAQVILEKRHTGSEAFSLTDTPLSLRLRRWIQSKNWDLAPGVSITIPGTRTVDDSDSFMLGAKLGPRLYFDFKRHAPVSGFFEVSFLKNFHAYQTAANGSLNSSHRLGHWLSVDLALPRALKLNLSAIYQSAWSYGGSIRNRFGFDQELSLALARGWGLAIGHSLSGDALKPDGISSNLALFDERASLFYGAVSLKL